MMLRKMCVTPFIVSLFLLFPMSSFACCGGCGCGNVHSSTTQSAKDDSLQIKKFISDNDALIQKIKEYHKKVEKEYEKTTPNYDEIAKLKKAIVDFNIELEKGATKKNIKKRPHCWCPMHR